MNASHKQDLIFVTSNKGKFEVAKKSLEKIGIDLVQENITTPEIQSTDVVEISAYSAQWAALKLNIPVVVVDVGYYIEALNGFPGPFIKYINSWLTSQDLLNLIADKQNRNVIVKGSLSYCEPNSQPVTFISEWNGSLAYKAVKTEKPGSTSINEIFIPDGLGNVETDISREEMIEFWSKSETYWTDLMRYLEQK